MDRYAFFALIPVLGISFTGLILFSFTRLGKALAHRLEGGVDEATRDRLAALEAANDELRLALMETQERLDFTERALLRGADERIDTPT